MIVLKIKVGHFGYKENVKNMDVQQIRRDIHQHPELGFTEFRTASIVVEKLQSFGFDVMYGKDVMDESACRGMPPKYEIEEAYHVALNEQADAEIIKHMEGGFTGVIGKMSGNKQGSTVAFRFDMDALPIIEAEDEGHVPFREDFHSLHKGKMHACGHDGHTAIGLKLAETLKDEDFAGTLLLIFQPAEEGGRGASSIAANGVLDNIDKLYCMHLGLDAPQGEVWCGTDGWLATTKINSTFHGVSSHAGVAPEKGKNALVGAATALLNIHALPRYSDGKTRVNVGALNGGTATNIIPDKATMVIETRSDKAEINEDLEDRVKNIVEHSAKMHDLDYEIEIVGEGTTIQCDESLINTAFEEAEELNLFSSVKRMGRATGSEDASILIKRVQEYGGEGTYMLIGTDLPAPHHHPAFDINEKSLHDAVKLLNRIATKELIDK